MKHHSESDLARLHGAGRIKSLLQDACVFFDSACRRVFGSEGQGFLLLGVPELRCILERKTWPPFLDRLLVHAAGGPQRLTSLGVLSPDLFVFCYLLSGLYKLCELGRLQEPLVTSMDPGAHRVLWRVLDAVCNTSRCLESRVSGVARSLVVSSVSRLSGV